MENIIRNLVAFGDTIDRTAFSLVWDYAECTLPTDYAARVRTIIEAEVGAGNITDSLLDEIIDAMDYGDMANE